VQLTTFYFANRTAFSRAGAQIRLDIDLMTPGAGPIADAGVLAWEYWNGTSWIAVPSIEDFGQRFCLAHGRGVVTFPRPADWEECAVGGAHNFWARVRIDSGRTSDGIEPYGGPIRYTATDSAVVASNEPRPPVVKRIEVGYAYSTEPQPVEHCLTVNDFVFEDHTSNTRWGQRAFVPFRPTVDHDPAIYLGFDRALPAATVSVFVAVPDKAGLATIDLVETNAFAWEYLSDTGWNDLVVADETRGFAQTGTVRFACPSDAIASDGPGGKLFRIRGRVPEDTRPAVRPIGAVWMNTVWASEERSYQLEPLGISDGAPDQACFLPNDRIPVIEGETVEVREWSGDGVGWELATVDVDPTALRLERAPATGRPTAVWVRWEVRPDLDASRSTDRHYAIERAGGVFRFGDGRRGMIPPGNARIAVTYRSGGGTAGNVPQRAISELRAAMPYIASATNLLPARGGAPVETLASLAARGPQRIRHRGRALAASDYEWLAREASTAVANARCLDVTAPDGRAMRGWVTVIVLPDDISPAPVPDAELLGRVRAYLAQRAPAGVSDRLSVGGPRYRVASVAADIVVRVGADPGEVETNVRDGLARFLHPVHGGPDDAGWSFGATLYVSQIARVIGRVAGVDRSSSLELAIDGLLVDDRIALRPDELPSSGTHRVRIRRAGSC
jgi:uncharacterized phage protein gp47/JayE